MTRARRHQIVGTPVIVIAIVVIATAAGCTIGGTGSVAATPTTGNAVMVRTVDGDTIIASIEGGSEETIRLLGIDTPESVARDRPNQCYGKEASTETDRLLPPGTELVLERDVEPRDRYDRLLAYVYRADDELFVNESLIRDGFAGTLSYAPNTTYSDRFASIEAAARQRGVGLWGACGGPDEPLE